MRFCFYLLSVSFHTDIILAVIKRKRRWENSSLLKVEVCMLSYLQDCHGRRSSKCTYTVTEQRLNGVGFSVLATVLNKTQSKRPISALVRIFHCARVVLSPRA